MVGEDYQEQSQFLPSIYANMEVRQRRWVQWSQIANGNEPTDILALAIEDLDSGKIMCISFSFYIFLIFFILLWTEKE